MTTRPRAHRPTPPRPQGPSAWADPVDLLRWPKGTERIHAERLAAPRPPRSQPPVAPLDPPEYR